MSLLKESRKSCGPPANGLRMSEWCGRQEDLMAAIGRFNESLGSQEFKDQEFAPQRFSCCSCASGQSAVVSLCKHDR